MASSVLEKTIEAAAINLGQNIKKECEKEGVPQSKIAEILGKSEVQVGRYLKGKNRLSAVQLYFIARLLKKPMSFFFNFDPYVPDRLRHTLKPESKVLVFRFEQLSEERKAEFLTMAFKFFDS